MRSISSQEQGLIWAAVALMLLIGFAFLGVLLLFNRRLKDESRTVKPDANEAGETLNPKPDASHFEGRDFQPQAEVSDDPFRRS